MTEILQKSMGFDNLHHAEGILKEAQENAARLYGTKQCYYSVNGSTAALLSAVSAAVPDRRKDSCGAETVTKQFIMPCI